MLLAEEINLILINALDTNLSMSEGVKIGTLSKSRKISRS